MAKPVNSNCKLELIIKEATFLKDADMFGKQDPFIQFTYDNKVYKTKTQDDAGKHANFNETFMLKDLAKQINNALKLDTYDEDPTGVDYLSSIKPIKFADLVKTSNVQEFHVDHFDNKGKKAGDITFSTRYIWAEPDPPIVKRDEKRKPMNKKCKLDVTIIDATFLKDADMFGKQDPFIKFKYGRGEFATTVKDDAGKYAEWNEKFTLSSIEKWLDNDLVLEAMEKDLASSDFLGSTKPIKFRELASWEGLVKHDVQIFDEKKKVCGSMKFTTMLQWVDYSPPPPSDLLDKKTVMRVIIKEAHFLKDVDTFGKQDPYIKFKYNDKYLQTDVKDDAGKEAKFDETF